MSTAHITKKATKTHLCIDCNQTTSDYINNPFTAYGFAPLSFNKFALIIISFQNYSFAFV